MPVWWLLGSLLLGLVLQSTLLSYLTGGRLVPDLVLIVVVLEALFSGSRRGAGVGMVFGLVEDLVSGSYMGLNVLVKMAIGYVYGWGQRRFYKENLLLPLGALFTATWLADMLWAGLALVVGWTPPAGMAFFQRTLQEAVYNSLVALVFYPLAYRVWSGGDGDGG